jgi:aspartate/methionine/tyrosine aminotransferase
MNKTAVLTTPVDGEIVRKKIKESKLPNIGKASIREILALINNIEKETGVKYIRMEMGIPGLKACNIGVEAEIEALRSGIANTYPSIEGVPALKRELSRFISLFMDINIPENCCIPCTGSTNGSFISFITTSRIHEGKNTSLFLDPGFPVHKQQLKVLGLPQKSLDVYDYRGEKLKTKLEEILSEGNISSILYSNPNNPSWICFTAKELQVIGELANKYDVIVLEDLAYFNMDFRVDHSKPGEPPFQPTVAKYTDNYILLISSSKIFSYAGQRIGSMAVSEKLYKRDYPDLLRFYTSPNFGHSLVYGTAYAVSAGTTHSSQFALAAMLKATNDGDYNFINDVKVYGKRAQIMKKIFLTNGFSIVYDMDDNEPIADGFYFTVSYPGYSGEELIEELLYYGISAISLSNTGSERREGIRACVSLVSDSQITELEERLVKFHENHRN